MDNLLTSHAEGIVDYQHVPCTQGTSDICKSYKLFVNKSLVSCKGVVLFNYKHFIYKEKYIRSPITSLHPKVSRKICCVYGMMTSP